MRAPLLALSLVTTACGSAPEAPADSPALVDSRRLRAAVEGLERRVERLDPGAYAVPAAIGAAVACDVLGVRTVAFGPGWARFTCNRLPPLGTGPVARPGGPAPARPPAAATVARAE
jgi:hypothetical protein